jgi:DNA-binding response OmpR family regulator
MAENIPNILIVDDSSTNNLLLESALSDKNLNITTAVNGQKALDILNKKDIDLVLLDVMMPGLSGYDVLESMLKKTKLASIPVIMVTARNQVEDMQKAKELGAIDYFEKPLNLDKLISRVVELVEK